jgi:hypothetical protein
VGPRDLAAVAALAAAAVLGGCKVASVNANRTAEEGYLRDLAGGPTGPEGAAPAAGGGEAPPESYARAFLKHRPLGHAGGGEGPGLEEGDLQREQVPVPDRWRIGFPSWDRGSKSDSPYDHGSLLDPYHQNWLKGDYPIPGTQNTFFVLEATLLLRAEHRLVPTPSGVFPANPSNFGFFGDGKQGLLEEVLLVSGDLFHGETSFRPVDWRFFVRGALNATQAKARENQALFADPSRGKHRNDRQNSLQQAFFETTLASVSPQYDVVQARVGSQSFNSDFRGFLFFDEAPGLRVFGTLDDNHWQWNAAIFRRWNKDTNSGLNEFESIQQRILLLNLYRQDLLAWLLPGGNRAFTEGLTGQVSWHRFMDEDSVAYDENGGLVRPQPVGTVKPNHRDLDYLGFNLDGHVGRLNVTSSYYRVLGDESFDEIAGRPTDVDASMAALELSVDVDWMRWKVFGFYQSGDRDPLDGDATGFDAIYDNPAFAGGEFGFWNRNGIRLTGSGLGLVHRFSLLNSLRSSKDEGQPNFVNPGLLLAGAGYDAQLTPHLKVIANASYLLFDDTAVIERVLNQDSIGTEIGYDLSVGAIWRPGLTDNVIVKGGVAALVPGHGFRDIYESETLYAVFAELILTW